MARPAVPEGVRVGEYFAYGEWDPGNGIHPRANLLTFSLGLYRAQLSANGKRVIASKALCRVKGYTAQAQNVRDTMAKICQKANAGFKVPKVVQVKWVL